MGNELKQAEQRGYSRGYQAGRKKAVTESDRAPDNRKKLPTEMQCQQQFWAAIGGMTYAELVGDVCERLRDVYGNGDFDLSDPKDWAELLNFVRLARENVGA